MPNGRFAPSPTGDLHLGNLRTALIAWLAARAAGSRFMLRMEDLDRANSSTAHERSQIHDLTAIGLDWDGAVLRQSERFGRHREAIDELTRRGLTFPCYCTRREIAEAVNAPHANGGERRYPGTCRALTPAQRRAADASGRPAATRLHGDGAEVTFVDGLAGMCRGIVDDIVLCRNDGVPAYNLAVVVDDADQRVEQVVRGDDLLSATPSQVGLGRLLGLAVPTYLHLPLVLGPDGARLAKRDGAVTLADRLRRGETAEQVRSMLAASLGLSAPGEVVAPRDLVERFDASRLPREPWVVSRGEVG